MIELPGPVLQVHPWPEREADRLKREKRRQERKAKRAKHKKRRKR